MADETTGNAGTAEGGTSATETIDPKSFHSKTWEQRAAEAAERIGPSLSFADHVTPEEGVDGAKFARLNEAAAKFSKLSEDAAGTRDSAHGSEVDTLLNTAKRMVGDIDDKTAAADAPAVSAGSGAGYSIGRIGDDVVDASLAAREAEMREVADYVGVDGALLTNGSAAHYSFAGTREIAEKQGQAISRIALALNDTYASAEQQWFKDLIGNRQPTLDLMGQLGGRNGLGEVGIAAEATAESVNQVIDKMNISAANYSQQFVAAVDAQSFHNSFGQKLSRGMMAADMGHMAAEALGHSTLPKPIVPDYGYIPALDSAASKAGEVNTTLSSVATNDLVGQMRELAGPLKGADTAGNALNPKDMTAGGAGGTGGGGARGGSGGGGARRGGTPRGGASRSGSTTRKKGASDDKVRAVADKLAALFEEAGGGKAGADAVAAAAGAQGLTADQLAAAGLSPEMLASMASNPMFNPSGAGMMQGGMPLGAYAGGSPLDQRLAGLGGTHLSNAGDLGGVRGALGADIGGSPMGLAGGAAGRPLSAEARSLDSTLASPPPPGVGSPVRSTALGADMRPLDPTGSGRMSPDAVPATRQNMLDVNGNPKVVDTTIEVGGEDHPISIDDPRLLEMMNIVSAEGSSDSPMPILEAAKRAGIELSSYGDYIANPLDAKPGDVVISGKGNGFYMGDGRVLMETGEIKPINEVLELRPPNSGIFRLALPELPDGDATGHKNWDEQDEGAAKGASSGGAAPSSSASAPSGDASFDPFAQTGGTPPPTTDAPMDSPLGPDTSSPAGDPGGSAPGTGTVPLSPSDPPRVVSELPESEAPISMGSSSSADSSGTGETDQGEGQDAQTATSGSIPSESLGMVEVEYEGKPLGDEPVRY